uniref:Uncharacterized protein n=1 Tax=Streptomyces sp. FQ1 TaxID=319426 RepID=Q58IM8_9ACTN|nr:unknown [Streptomyces sp. FQ1]
MLATADDFHGPTAYLALCAVAGLQPTAEGYGLLLVLDADGRPYTAVTCDVDYVRLLLDAWGPPCSAARSSRALAAAAACLPVGWGSGRPYGTSEIRRPGRSCASRCRRRKRSGTSRSGRGCGLA